MTQTPQQTQCPPQKLLCSYLDECLSAEDSRGIEDHFKDCGACEGRIQTLLQDETALLLLSPQSAPTENDAAASTPQLHHVPAISLILFRDRLLGFRAEERRKWFGEGDSTAPERN